MLKHKNIGYAFGTLALMAAPLVCSGAAFAESAIDINSSTATGEIIPCANWDKATSILTLNNCNSGAGYIDIDGVDVEIVLTGENSFSDGITTTGSLAFSGDGHLTIDGDDTLNTGVKVAGDLVIKSGSFDIVDVAVDGFKVDGDITIDGGDFYVAPGDDAFDNNGEIVVNNGQFMFIDEYGFNPGTDLVINNGLFGAESSEIFYLSETDGTINGGTFRLNNGASIYVDEAIFTINDGEFSITGSYHGPWIDVEDGGSVIFNAGTITSDITAEESSAPGISLYNSDFEMNGGTLNLAGFGSGIYFDGNGVGKSIKFNGGNVDINATEGAVVSRSSESEDRIFVGGKLTLPEQLKIVKVSVTDEGGTIYASTFGYSDIEYNTLEDLGENAVRRLILSEPLPQPEEPEVPSAPNSGFFTESGSKATLAIMPAVVVTALGAVVYSKKTKRA